MKKIVKKQSLHAVSGSNLFLADSVRIRGPFCKDYVPKMAKIQILSLKYV